MTPEEEIQALMAEFESLGIPKPKGNFRNPEGLRAKLEEAKAAVAGDSAPAPAPSAPAPDPYPLAEDPKPEPVKEGPKPPVTSEVSTPPPAKKTPVDPLKESLTAIDRLRLFSDNKQVGIWLDAIEKTIIKDFGL